MTAIDLHIDFDINLQKISTNATRNIEPEEVDWLLNKEVIKFLNKRTRDISDNKRRGFEEDTKRLKDIDTLVRTVSLSVKNLGNGKGEVILPPFNFKSLKASAVFYKDCEASEGKTFNETKNVYKFKLPTANAVNDLKVTVVMFGVIKILYTTLSLPTTYIGGEYINLLKSFIIQVRKALLTSEFEGLEMYYEWYGEKYEQDTFFIVGNTKLSSVKLTKTTADTSEFPVSFYTNVRPVTASSKAITKPVRFVSSELIDWKIDSFLSGSIEESPLVELTKGIGFVYFPKNTIVKQLIFTYICRPNLIDLSLNTSLNLDTDICAEIVLDTVRFTKALLDSDNYEKYFNETNLIE